MSERFADNRAMVKNVAVLTVACFMLCLSINYTFPLHRDSTQTPLDNHSQICQHGKQEHPDGIVDRTKKMAANLENALKKFIDSSSNKARGKCSHAKHGVIDNDLSNFEQLVIMKKYPYLDLQEIDFNIGQLSNKNAGHQNSAQVQDPSYCESPDEGPSVEISNRGLSGFAIPAKLSRPETKGNPTEVLVTKDDEELVNRKELKISSSTQEPTKESLDDLRLIESLEEDIRKFEEKQKHW